VGGCPPGGAILTRLPRVGRLDRCAETSEYELDELKSYVLE